MLMIAGAVAAFLTFAFASAALAASWTTYGNARFGYVVDLPPGFSAIQEAENGDGGRSSAPDGHTALSVWGSNLIEETFRQDVGSRIASDTREGWVINYRTKTGRGASWSGSKGSRIVYVRAISPCRDQAVFVRIEYDASAKVAFDPIVARVAKSLKASGGC